MNDGFPIQSIVPPHLDPDLLGGKPSPSEDAEAAARDFESLLLHKLLEAMDKTIIRSELFDSNSSDQIRGMFNHFLAQELAQQGGIGLWRQLHRQMRDMTQTPDGDQDRPSLEQEL